jgi:hypothetical protein
MTKKSPGRAERRLAAREAARRDGKTRNTPAIRLGQRFRPFKAKRTSAS